MRIHPGSGYSRVNRTGSPGARVHFEQSKHYRYSKPQLSRKPSLHRGIGVAVLARRYRYRCVLPRDPGAPGGPLQPWAPRPDDHRLLRCPQTRTKLRYGNAAVTEHTLVGPRCLSFCTTRHPSYPGPGIPRVPGFLIFLIVFGQYLQSLSFCSRFRSQRTDGARDRK